LLYKQFKLDLAVIRTQGVETMRSREGFAVRQLALAALEKSVKMLEVAYALVKQGNKREAKRLWSEAVRQRTISTWMVAEADNLERDLTGGRWFKSTVANN
jgi:hypothetical protein